MNRLTARSKNREAYYPVCIEACDGDLQDCGNCDIDKDICDRLAAYEDSQMTPEEVRSLAQAKADGRLKILPAKSGDIIYRPEALQFCWVITKVEIYEDEIVFIDDSDNIFRPDDIGKTVFLTREEAEAAKGVKTMDSKYLKAREKAHEAQEVSK
jgi:hypothetical protein